MKKLVIIWQKLKMKLLTWHTKKNVKSLETKVEMSDEEFYLLLDKKLERYRK